ncbi:hypothetical protein [Thauera sp. WH-1]|uniref:hypothetical protein n=1 Tax=Thauera sp. WH-1 TaxID=3398230 RepID=UPI0039FD7621
MTRSAPTLLAPIRSAVLALLLGAAALPALAQTAANDDARRAADRARIAALEAEGKALRAQADATFAAAEAACHQRFLVNRCIDQARQARLQTIQRARAVEAEARRLTLAERQRNAEALMAEGARPLTPGEAASPAEPTSLPALPTASPTPPSPDAAIAPSPAAERIRAEREASSREAEADAARRRAAADAEREAARQRSAEEAARRAEQAERDRARYDERLRRYEEEQAQKKK